MSILYTCYSVPLMKFLTVKKGLRYELVALNPNTEKTFWIFIRDEKLNEALKEWSLGIN
ncbi:MAG: hypothetical protein ACRC1P_10900 [Cellulosilyticaceae bacterium]